MTVNCVIVTYNRLDLLKECLEAVEGQTRPVNKVIVIDNCSTDDTAAYLETFSGNPRYVIRRTTGNIGGAGGFSMGLRESVMQGCDFSWIMDDDTIPAKDALEKLTDVAENHPSLGFVCSRVNWTDGRPHIMNRPGLVSTPPEKQKEASAVCLCHQCSFVSVLVSTQAVRKVGLPIKEFFIWCDDIEYTERIWNAGFDNYYAPDSVVLHKTKENYYPSVDVAPLSTAWRFYYQARNTCYMKRRKTRFRLFFYISVWNKYRVLKYRIKKRTDGHYREFLDAVRRGCKDGLTFCPEIEFV